MIDIIDYLQQLELSDIEAKLYLTLLETGPISVRDLAEAIKIKRTTTYLYIAKLIEKELIVKVVKGSQKLIAANDPKESLEYLVKKKLQAAQSVEREFPDMMKLISTSLPQIEDVGEAEVKYYKGINGVSKIYEEALKAKELRSYVNLGDIEKYFPENPFSFDKAFEKNSELKLYEIVDDSPASRKIVTILTQNKRYNFKFLPKDIKITASDILIYEGKVAIINVRNAVTGVVFHNKDYFNISKELFEHMWRTLPAIK